MVNVGFCTLLALLLFLPSYARGQELPSIFPTPEADCASADKKVTRSPDPAGQEEHPRLFWIIPTYSVSNSKLACPLSSHDKFHIFVKNAVDPFTLGYTAIEAGLKQASNNPSGYGQGAAGYGKRLGAGLADESAAGFFTTYVFPSVLHQDPRYFRQGSGPVKNRLAHAMIRPIVTRTDSGGHAFNWSGLLGSIAACTLSNAYYSAGDRGVRSTFERVAFGIPSSMIDHVVDEFGSDLEKKVLRQKR